MMIRRFNGLQMKKITFTMFKDLKISKSSISFIYYCVQNDFAAEDYRAKFEAYVNHVVTKKYKIKGKFKVQSRATITSIDDKTEAFHKAQNKWNELNEHHFKQYAFHLLCCEDSVRGRNKAWKSDKVN